MIVAGHNPNEPILIEQYIPGVELAVEGVLRSGELEVLAFFDKPDPMEGPFFEETLFITPSRLHPEMLEEVERVTVRALQAMGLREGPVHAELRVDGSLVTFLEAAARSIGGLCGRSLRFGLLGTPLEVVLLRHALGRPLRKTRREDPASGVMMLPISRAGILRAVHGIDRALEVPGITEVDITIPPGRRVWPLPEADRYLGFLFARVQPRTMSNELCGAGSLRSRSSSIPTEPWGLPSDGLDGRQPPKTEFWDGRDSGPNDPRSRAHREP